MTAQIEVKLCTSVFYPNFRDLNVGIILRVPNESFSGHYELFILYFISQLEVRSETYGFSNADHQTVT